MKMFVVLLLLGLIGAIVYVYKFKPGLLTGFFGEAVEEDKEIAAKGGLIPGLSEAFGVRIGKLWEEKVTGWLESTP